MHDPIRVEGPVGGPDRATMWFEAGHVAAQADGAVIAGLGQTSVLTTAVSKGAREGIDFFPLTVDVEERMYAAGKIPGSFFRREGRPSEQAILACRLTDRPLRPSFPEGFRNDTQVIATILGVDFANAYDVVVINGASAALTVSGIPFDGPIGATRLSHHDGQWLVNPTYDERNESTFELVVAGRRTDAGDIAIMMVEAGGTEGAWALYEGGAPKVTEALIADGLEAAKAPIGASIDLQLELRRRLEAERGPIKPVTYDTHVDYADDVAASVQERVGDQLREAVAIGDKQTREARIDEIKAELVGHLVGTPDAPGPYASRGKEVSQAFRSAQKQLVRSRIVNEGVRIDGRGTADIRALSARVDVIPTAHGTGLFQRGETQVLSVLTLGMPKMVQNIDTIGVDVTKRYMHHYNFAPFSTGETGRVGSPKRREIGHGALAERALLPVIPDGEEFPYTIRVVSEVLASNGSTSMGSVCGSTLALMAGGVPIKAPVAGIAMGLVYAEGKYTTLTDILGAEDAFGDMDFKVAGTRDFVTALQLDTKIDGIPADVLAEALRQAYDARIKILDVMAESLEGPRDTVGRTAPQIVSFEIPGDKIGEIIGPKGKTIRTIESETGAEVSVDGDGAFGVVTVGARDASAMDAARSLIEQILNPPQPEIGKVYQGQVVNITKFGAFVNIMPGRDGLVHISKLGKGKRIERVEDVLSLGEVLEVTVDDIDSNGKLSLSLVGDEPPDGGGGDAAETAGANPPAAAADAAPAASPTRGGDRREGGRDRARDDDRGGRDEAAGPDRDLVSFEDWFDTRIAGEYGDLGPGDVGAGAAGRGGAAGDRGRPRRRRTRR